MIKTAALIVSVIGIFVLLLMLNYQTAVFVENINGMERLVRNTKVKTYGNVIDERIYGGFRIFRLDNDIEIVCDCTFSLRGKNVFVTGVIEDYTGRKQVRALSVKGQLIIGE